MMKVVGVARNCFHSRKDGAEVCGYDLYFAVDLTADKGFGISVERQYLSDAKAAAWGIKVPDLIGHTVQATFNHWGKLAALTVLD